MASIPDNFEIIVAKKETPYDAYGKHWCKIELPDPFPEKAKEKLEFLRNLFGDEYHITMIEWQCRGYQEDDWK